MIKQLVGGWIDERWDHTAILMEGDPDPAVPIIAASNAAAGRPVYWMAAHPTAENLVAELARVAQRLLAPTGVRVVSIRLWETPNGSAEWRASSEPTAIAKAPAATSAPKPSPTSIRPSR